MATPFINQGCSKPDTALPQVLLTPVSGLRWTETRSTWQRLKLQWGGVSRKSSLPQVKPLPRLPCQSQHWTRRPHSAHGPRPSFRNTHLKPLSHPSHDAMLAASAREDPALLWGLTQTQATLATVTSPATISFIPHNPSLQRIGTTGALASTLVPVLPTGLNPGGQELRRVTLGRHP